MRIKSLLLFLLVLTSSIFACKKETITETKTLTVIDTVYLTIHDTLTIPTLINDTATTFIVVRHAERDNVGADPILNAAGIVRAEELKRILEKVPVEAVYATPYNRTRQTVSPTASSKSLTVTDYSTSTPYLQLVNQFKSSHKGKVILIAGHSNTVPEILKALTANAYNITIADTQFDHLFIVSASTPSNTQVVHLKYGVATP